MTFKELFEEIKFELEYRYREIKSFIFSIKEGIKNLIYFFPVIWKYRWWDFEFFLDVVEHILQDYTKHYGEDSHFVGDKFTQKRACVLLKLLREYRESIDDPTVTKEETKRKKMKFFVQLGKNIERFWD